VLPDDEALDAVLSDDDDALLAVEEADPEDDEELDDPWLLDEDNDACVVAAAASAGHADTAGSALTLECRRCNSPGVRGNTAATNTR